MDNLTLSNVFLHKRIWNINWLPPCISKNKFIDFFYVSDIYCVTAKTPVSTSVFQAGSRIKAKQLVLANNFPFKGFFLDVSPNNLCLYLIRKILVTCSFVAVNEAENMVVSAPEKIGILLVRKKQKMDIG